MKKKTIVFLVIVIIILTLIFLFIRKDRKNTDNLNMLSGINYDINSAGVLGNP